MNLTMPSPEQTGDCNAPVVHLWLDSFAEEFESSSRVFCSLQLVLSGKPETFHLFFVQSLRAPEAVHLSFFLVQHCCIVYSCFTL